MQNYTSPETARDAHTAINSGYANYVLGVLFVVYIFNFVDRQVLSVFIGPIKEEFGASDTQMGLLVGFAFALLYTIAGIPLGIVFLSTADIDTARWCFLGFFLLLNVYLPAMFSANQSLAKLDMRATASALMLFCANIVGAGVGPLLVGALSDFFAAEFGSESIRYALLCCVIIGGVGSLLLLLSSRFLESDINRATALN